VRLHFQARPWDLAVSVGYSLVLTVGLLVLGAGTLVAILLVLFVPGYVFVSALFPGNEDLDWIERLVLSVALSIVIVPLLGLGLNLTPFGIRFGATLVTVALFTTLTGMAAYWRRIRLPIEDRLTATLELAWPSLEGYSLLDKIASFALIATVIGSGCMLVYVLATPAVSERFTEFYTLGPGGNASGYPTKLNVSQPGTVLLGLINHESATVSYAVQVDLVGLRIVHNTSASVDTTVEVNRTTLSWINITLIAGSNWTRLYTFSVTEAGLWKIQFLLFKDGDFSSAYRELHLDIRVT